MSTLIEMKPSSDRELVMGRHLKAPREAAFRCWTDPLLIPKWFAPKPWGVSRAEVDVRAGGSSLVVMKSPEGQEFGLPRGLGQVRRPARRTGRHPLRRKVC